MHNHLLPSKDSAREGKLVASIAAGTSSADNRKAVGQVGGDLRKGLFTTHVGSATRTPGLSIGVGQGAALDIAGLDWVGDPRRRPCAGGFAAVTFDVRNAV